MRKTAQKNSWAVLIACGVQMKASSLEKVQESC